MILPKYQIFLLERLKSLIDIGFNNSKQIINHIFNHNNLTFRLNPVAVNTTKQRKK